MEKRKCAARDCTRTVESRFLMCGYHWHLVPQVTRNRIWAEYRVGQENDLSKVTVAYVAALTVAVQAVADKEAIRSRRHA